ncbi:MAG: tRNA pseudouridine(55) synthase TruB [Clostridia bacterium]|nr:tRNA pseudouridine(55) synthase TruB [Clostridia bacterium]
MKGIVIMDKPMGVTSFKALGLIKKAYGTKRVGHTGTLDPDATGVLPILVGNATRAAELIVATDKEYITTILLGVKTDTLDMSGTVLEEREVNVTEDEIRSTVAAFVGEIEQIPPMYSAISVDGVRLHHLARQGIEIEREPRPVTIHEIEILDISLPEVTLRVSCSKGTYIRTLADDIGEKLGTLAAVKTLRRSKTGIFDLSMAHSPESIAENPEGCLMDLSLCFPQYEILRLDEKKAKMVKNGVPVYINAKEGVTYRVFDQTGEFISISRVEEIDGRLCLKLIKGFY